MKIKTMIMLFAVLATMSVTAAEARNHRYYNGYSNRYDHSCGWHRHHHRRW